MLHALNENETSIGFDQSYFRRALQGVFCLVLFVKLSKSVTMLPKGVSKGLKNLQGFCEHTQNFGMEVFKQEPAKQRRFETFPNMTKIKILNSTKLNIAF